MKAYVVAILATFYVALCAALSIPMGPGDVSLFGLIYGDAGTAFKVTAVVVMLAPLFLAFALFRRDAEISRWHFERATMSRDIKRLLGILAGLGKAQKELATGVYEAGTTDVAGEAEMLVASLGSVEAQLAMFEAVSAKVPDIERLLTEAARQQGLLADRLAKVRAIQDPLVQNLAALQKTRAGIAEAIAALDKQGGAEKFRATLNESVGFIDTSGPTVDRLGELALSAAKARSALEALRDRIAPIVDKKSGLVAQIAAMHSLRDSLASGLSELGRDGDIETKVSGMSTFLSQSMTRLKAVEDALPRVIAARSAAEQQRTRLETLEDVNTGILAEIGHLDTTIGEIRESLTKVESDDGGVPLRVRLDRIDALRGQLDARVTAVEQQAMRLVGLAGGLAHVEKRVNGAA